MGEKKGNPNEGMVRRKDFSGAIFGGSSRNIRAKWSKMWKNLRASRLTSRGADPLPDSETRTLAI